MGFKIPIALLLALLFSSTASAEIPNFLFNLENPVCGQLIDVPPGERVRFEVFVTLTAPQTPVSEGAKGWSLGVGVTNGTLEGFSLDGLVVDTVFDEDHDGDPSTPPVHHDSYPQDLGSPEVFDATVKRGVYDFNPDIGGVISRVILRDQGEMVFKPGTTQRVLKITVSAVRGISTYLSMTTDLIDEFGHPFRTEIFTREVTWHSYSGATCSISSCCSEDFRLALAPVGRPFDEGSGDMAYEDMVPAGDVLVPVEVLLTTRNLGARQGPQGWSLCVVNEICMSVPTVTLKNMFVDTHYEADPDEDRETPPIIHENYPMDLSKSFTNIAHEDHGITPCDSSLMGVVSAVVMKSQERMTLYPNTAARILRVVYKLHVEQGQTITCKAFFKNQDFQCANSRTSNFIISNGSIAWPVTRGLVIKLTGGDMAPRPLMRRGDVNADLQFDLSDVIKLIGGLFLNDSLPCLEAGDADGNGQEEITDVIYLVNWLYLNGPQPAAPYPHCGYAENGRLETCPLSSNACHGLF